MSWTAERAGLESGLKGPRPRKKLVPISIVRPITARFETESSRVVGRADIPIPPSTVVVSCTGSDCLAAEVARQWANRRTAKLGLEREGGLLAVHRTAQFAVFLPIIVS